MTSSKIEKAEHLLAYARLAIAGGIGGVALYNTAMLFVSASPTQSFESIAMAAGAVVSAAAAKIFHLA
ncbi:hypothetical protein [Azonexus sp. IMCC34839]|uniref:hypothetical protein n=1 Tax=Azonexus sp. IMCC34839 TaxID=3133695 RepID=UPI00399B7566